MLILITTAYRRARPSTMPQMDFPDSHEHEVDKWKVGNCLEPSAKSSSTKTYEMTTMIGNAENTVKCDLGSWMLTSSDTLSSQPGSSMEITNGCKPDVWTPVQPVHNTPQSDDTSPHTMLASDYQQTTNSSVMITTQLCWHCAMDKNLNTVRADSCTCTCKCCS